MTINKADNFNTIYSFWENHTNDAQSSTQNEKMLKIQNIARWDTLTKHLRKKNKNLTGSMQPEVAPLASNPIDAKLIKRYTASLLSAKQPSDEDHKLSQLSVKIHKWTLAYCKLYNQLLSAKTSLSYSGMVFLTGLQGVQAMIMNGETDFPSSEEYQKKLTPGQQILDKMDQKEQMSSLMTCHAIKKWEYNLSKAIQKQMKSDYAPSKGYYKLQEAYVASIHAIAKKTAKIPYQADAFKPKHPLCVGSSNSVRN